jgi:hypothetical protein
MGEKLVPFPTRDDLIRQIPGVKRSHSSYAAYAKISQPEDLFLKEQLDNARKLPAYEFRSGVYFQDEKGDFSFTPFPEEVQWGPIMGIAIDVNSEQIWLGGNFSGFRADLGKSMNLIPMAYRWKNGKWLKEPVISSFSRIPELRTLEQIQVKAERWILGLQNDGVPIWLR